MDIYLHSKDDWRTTDYLVFRGNLVQRALNLEPRVLGFIVTESGVSCPELGWTDHLLG